MEVRSRTDWGATAPLGPRMTLPVSEAWLHHSVTTLTDDPVADMKVIERVGVSRFGRFSYSWAYHRPSRLLLEGAGDTIGAHTAGRNSTSLGLVLIGNYDTTPLDDVAVADLAEAFDWLVAGNRLRPGAYPTGGHRDLKQTACPGGNAYARIDDIRNWEDDMNVQELVSVLRSEGVTGGGQYAKQVLDLLTPDPSSPGIVTESLRAEGISAGIQTLLARAGGDVDETEIAQQIVAAMPDSLKAAVKAALREGTG